MPDPITAANIVRFFEGQAKSPQMAWDLARAMRNLPRDQRPFPNQQLADAEHYLYAKYQGSKSVPEALRQLVLPFGWSAYKSMRELGGATSQELGSRNTLKQQAYGVGGAWDALRGLLSE